jgi:hypothetical protein
MKMKLSWSKRFKAFFNGSLEIEVPKPQIEIKKEVEIVEKPVIKEVEKKVIQSDDTSALLLLNLLQKHGRLIDFLHEEIDQFSDEEVGGAARVVHQGLNQVFKEHIKLMPVRSEEEETKITVEKGFDTQAIHLVGNIQGEAPFEGVLTHKGWQLEAIDLPKVTQRANLKVITPAEVEL